MRRKPERQVRIKAVGCSLLFLAVAAMLGGCVWIRDWLNPNNPPVAVIRANVTFGKAPLEVLFDASESYDPDGDDIVDYRWDFGDGNTGNGSITRHGFGSPGDYAVRLTVVDKRGAIRSTTLTIMVYEPSAVVQEYQFDARLGGEFDTGTGLAISVPPVPSDSSITLVVKHIPDPAPPPDDVLVMLSAYTIHMASTSTVLSKQVASPSQVTAPPYVELLFDIPPDADPDSMFVLEWTAQGWRLAVPGYGPEAVRYLGGILTPDKKRLIFRLYLPDVSALSYPMAHPEPPWSCLGTGYLMAKRCGEEIEQGRSFGRPHIDTSQLPKVGLWSPGIPPLGGLWYKVEVTNVRGVTGYEWQPPDPKDPRAYGSDGSLFLQPTPEKEGILTLQFEPTGGSAKICLNALDKDALSLTSMDLVFGTLISAVKLLESVLIPLQKAALGGKSDWNPRTTLGYLADVAGDVLLMLVGTPGLIAKLVAYAGYISETGGMFCDSVTVQGQLDTAPPTVDAFSVSPVTVQET